MSRMHMVDLPRIVVLGLYGCTAAWGAAQVIRPDDALPYLLFSLLLAALATQWCVIDSRRKGKPMLHIVQMLTFLSWPLAVPLYLVWSRRLRGLALAVLHSIALVVVLCLGFYTAILVLYGPGAFSAR